MKNRMRHAGIYVENLEKMKTFYCKNFNLNVKVHDVEESKYIDTILGLQNVSMELYKLGDKNGDTMVELLVAQKISGDNQGEIYEKGRMHLAFTVDSLDEIYDKFVKEGVEFISKPCVNPSGTAKVCFCRDPEGNYLELVEEIKN